MEFGPYTIGTPTGWLEVRVLRCRCPQPLDPQRTYYDDDLEITRADDIILIADYVVECWERGEGAPGMSYGDRIVTIRGTNRTVSYGLLRRDPYRRAWLAVRSPDVSESVSE